MSNSFVQYLCNFYVAVLISCRSKGEDSQMLCFQHVLHQNILTIISNTFHERNRFNFEKCFHFSRSKSATLMVSNLASFILFALDIDSKGTLTITF